MGGREGELKTRGIAVCVQNPCSHLGVDGLGEGDLYPIGVAFTKYQGVGFDGCISDSAGLGFLGLTHVQHRTAERVKASRSI